MLHDIIQQYSNWPNIWYREPWNKYDIGILPSDQWEKNWMQCSQWAYARPRVGMYKIGWPKADAVAKLQATTYRDDFYKKYGMDPNKRTVLYAPAWENDAKQDDFVRSMLKLDVNIVIKQADWNPAVYPDQVRNIKEMYELHKDSPEVTILPPATNIFEAIAVSDLLVSEESSTMCEATMMGVPAVSVSDWLIPDVTPSRLPKCDYDFVYMTKKAELSDFVRKLFEDYDAIKVETEKTAAENFRNIGKTSQMIMDILDDYIAGEPIRHPAIPQNPQQKIPVAKELRRNLSQFKLEMSTNYTKRNPFLGAVWRVAKKAKKILKG